jgi:hypothetical protein
MTKRKTRKENETAKQQPKQVEAKTPNQKEYIRSIPPTYIEVK